MDNLKTGPVFWVDSADSQPCVGTAGVAQWQLDFKGKLFHSGMPNRGINAIEFAQDSISYIQKRFYVDYKKHPDEITYNFMTSSTLKPTQISCTQGSINQIPPGCCVQGDIRLVPFYDISDVMKSLEAYVRDINASPSIVESGAHGPHSKYELVEEELKGLVKLTWITPGENGKQLPCFASDF
jgi:acetylornithine deacetylase